MSNIVIGHVRDLSRAFGGGFVVRNSYLRFRCALFLTCTLSLLSSGCNDTKLAPVTEWLVAFGKDAGAYVQEHAQVFAMAVKRAWTVFWDSGIQVLPDQSDPSMGRYVGKLKCSVEFGKGRMQVELNNPRMIRNREDPSRWELDPRDRQEIDEIQSRLLRG